MPTNKNIESPAKLYEFFETYKSNCKANPKQENIYDYKASLQVGIDREIPLTWNGFELWLRKSKILAKLDDYKANKDNRYAEYADIIRAIDLEIYEDKFCGAVAGIFNHNIIARDLGLQDKQQTEHTGEIIVKPPKFD